jgi:predicted nuclease with RNAse H fold
MRVLGIDLAAQAKKTYACVLEHRDGKLEARLHGGCGDDELIKLAKGCVKVGIDAPFGWPDEFVSAVTAHRDRLPWPAPPDPDTSVFRRLLSLRLTDRIVTDTRRPLSVSTDRIGVTAMRCAHLLSRWQVRNRAGTGRFVEVYPAAALARWNLNPSGYKRSDRAPLAALLERLRKQLRGLSMDTEAATLCATNDDAFDALVAALVARARAVGLTDPPPPAHRSRAEREGWIHLPVRGSLPYLARDSNRLEAEPKRVLARNAAGGSVPHSSADLAKAVFTPFAREGWPVGVGGKAFSGKTTFEAKRSAGVKGGAPTLDVLVEGDRVLAIESKYTEPFSRQLAKFEETYATPMEALHPSWRREFELLREDPRRYRHLKADQLVKHYMGLRNCYPDTPVTLAYLYWRPSNAADIAACAIHAAEVKAFCGAVDDPAVKLIAKPYDELWSEWSKARRPAELKKHARALIARYVIPL